MTVKKRAIISESLAVILLLVFLTSGIIVWQSSLFGQFLIADNNDAIVESHSRSFVHDVSDTIREQAWQFVWDRKQAYTKAGRIKDFKMRGVGYLLHAHNVVLAAEIPHNSTTRADGQNNVTIYNVLNTTLDCRRLTLWVRVNGPEIFAGSAVAVQTLDDKCFWEFPFDLQVPGEYHVHVKALIWNGDVPVHMTSKLSQCAETRGSLPQKNNVASWPVHSSMAGFKFYSSIEGCCEICTRLQPHCRYWATPPFNYTAAPMRNGCELYFDQHVDPDYIPAGQVMDAFKKNVHRRRLLVLSINNHSKDYSRRRRRLAGNVPHAHGAPHHHPTSYFVGCGWSFWMTLEIPCLSGDLDDQVFLPRTSFTFDNNQNNKPTLTQPQLPLCTLEHEQFGKHYGRWVREDWPDPTNCPQPFAIHDKFKDRFEIAKFDGNHPHCWHRDDLSRCCHKCVEMNCRFIQKESKWIGPLHEEKKWFGYWKHDNCDYLEFSNTQLQQCITTRKIASITVRGASIAQYLEQYIWVRTEPLTFYNATLPGAKHVVLDTLALLHVMRYEELMHEKMQSMPVVDEATTEHYWVSGFYLSSEREPLGHLHSMNRSNYVAASHLKPKGYKMINNFDMAAAFSYDTATQFDGMHIIGPPMKMSITKLFHFMCKDTVKGSRLSKFS